MRKLYTSIYRDMLFYLMNFGFGGFLGYGECVSRVGNKTIVTGAVAVFFVIMIVSDAYQTIRGANGW